MERLKFAVVGHPIGHTMSPFIHLRLFELAGLHAEYAVLDIEPERLLDEAERSLAALDGYNLTIPHKSVIIPALREISGKAARYGSVNTVDCRGGMRGYSTDPDGFLLSLAAAGVPLRGPVTVLGSGGVARVFAFESALAGCPVTIAVRERGLGSARALADAARAVAPGASVRVCTLSALEEETEDIDLLINATPVGMFPNAGDAPVGPRTLSHCAAVFDAVYNPAQTKLLSLARANGAKTVGGMPMLVYQAAEAHRIWHGSVYDREAIDELCRDALREMARVFGG